jgi:hypothetical protein
MSSFTATRNLPPRSGDGFVAEAAVVPVAELVVDVGATQALKKTPVAMVLLQESNWRRFKLICGNDIFCVPYGFCGPDV